MAHVLLTLSQEEVPSHLPREAPFPAGVLLVRPSVVVLTVMTSIKSIDSVGSIPPALILVHGLVGSRCLLLFMHGDDEARVD